MMWVDVFMYDCRFVNWLKSDSGGLIRGSEMVWGGGFVGKYENIWVWVLSCVGKLVCWLMEWRNWGNGVWWGRKVWINW